MPPALLDTDILSELIKLRNTNVRQKALVYVQQHGQLAFSAITRYEITRGYKDQNATTQMARFATFCQHAIVLPVTEAIFDRAADLWVLARQGGHSRNDADLIIAATAHDCKFSSAVLEDFHKVSPAWRNRYLATSVHNLRGSGDRDNSLVERTRAALG